MPNQLKYAANDFAGGTDWRTLYTCPGARTAIVKAVIAANDNSSAGTVTAVLGVQRSWVVTQLTGNIQINSTAAVNLLAGTLAMEAGDILVTKTTAQGSRWKVGLAVPGGNINRFEVNGITVIALTGTGIWRTADMLTWTQVDTANTEYALIAYIGTTWFVYTSATAARISTDDGLTWSAQAVTNAPFNAPASKMGGGIVKNGNTFAGLSNGGTAMTTTANGITWTLSTALPTLSRNLAWTGTNYVATSASVNSAYYSTNGVAWTTVTLTGLTGACPQGCLASNGAILLASNTTGLSRSIDHGATWASAGGSGGPTVSSNSTTIWTGGVFAVQDTNWQVSTTGAINTWDAASVDIGAGLMESGFVYGGNVYRQQSNDIFVSEGLLLPAFAGLQATASVMEVF